MDEIRVNEVVEILPGSVLGSDWWDGRRGFCVLRSDRVCIIEHTLLSGRMVQWIGDIKWLKKMWEDR